MKAQWAEHARQTFKSHKNLPPSLGITPPPPYATTLMRVPLALKLNARASEKKSLNAFQEGVDKYA